MKRTYLFFLVDLIGTCFFKQSLIYLWFLRCVYKLTLKRWEYSVEKDAAYCLYCYLFKPHNKTGGGDCFSTEEFRNWRRIDKFEIQVDGPNDAYNKARGKADNLLKQKQSI